MGRPFRNELNHLWLCGPLVTRPQKRCLISSGPSAGQEAPCISAFCLRLVPGLPAHAVAGASSQDQALTAGSECPSLLPRLPLPLAPSPGAFTSKHRDPWGYFTPLHKV